MTFVSSQEHERSGPDGLGAVPYIPLSREDDAGADGGGKSIGTLVGEATQHLSTLVRAEVELAKSEVVGEVKKGLTGSVYFMVAAVVGLYSSFFFFFFLGELLSDWWGLRWPAFLTVFGLMLVFTLLFAFLGYRKMKKIRAPQRTITSVKDTAAALKPRREAVAEQH
ncbi:phage holin family protein [Amycolatopsis cynarae]|uniref:Phage holin family protein n=1 Tax=Amycolatopsis cynarae TaxID=2995223 RepID=A0ABY7B270_9PSEU|nr:phage holin family protein [Amycolatopsis sp. HUAS 11-8]WAL66059.1 phage holin family protein [Amycolatopsis sp. HUAS 11-8]